jgi:hypothetical protein
MEIIFCGIYTRRIGGIAVSMNTLRLSQKNGYCPMQRNWDMRWSISKRILMRSPIF